MAQGNPGSGQTGRALWSDEEELEFRALFSIAWALRGTAAYRAALETITDWHSDLCWRRAQTYLAHRAVADAEIERLVQLLRATDPARIGTKATA